MRNWRKKLLVKPRELNFCHEVLSGNVSKMSSKRRGVIVVSKNNTMSLPKEFFQNGGMHLGEARKNAGVGSLSKEIVKQPGTNFGNPRDIFYNKIETLNDVFPSVPEIGNNGEGIARNNQIVSAIFKDATKEPLWARSRGNGRRIKGWEGDKAYEVARIAVACSKHKGVKLVGMEQNVSIDYNLGRLSDGKFVKQVVDLSKNPNLMMGIVGEAQALDPKYKKENMSLGQIGADLERKSGLTPKGEIYNAK